MKKTPLSSPGLTGGPSIPEAFEIDRGAAAYWIARSSRATTVLIVAAAFPSPSFFLGALATKQSILLDAVLMDCFAEPSSGSHARDPLARNDELLWRAPRAPYTFEHRPANRSFRPYEQEAIAIPRRSAEALCRTVPLRWIGRVSSQGAQDQ